MARRPPAISTNKLNTEIQNAIQISLINKQPPRPLAEMAVVVSFNLGLLSVGSVEVGRVFGRPCFVPTGVTTQAGILNGDETFGIG